MKKSPKSFSSSMANLLVIEKQSIDSTQDEAIRILQKKSVHIARPYVVIAGEQTTARGRTGKKWIAPAGKNIYFSLVIDIPPHWKESTHLLSPSVSLSLQNQLQLLGVQNSRIKWPNDIIINGKKLSGVLVELYNVDQSSQAIIGVGMNLNLRSEECENLLKRPITSLLAETNLVWNVSKTTLIFLERILEDIASPQNSPENVYKTWVEKCTWMVGEQVNTHHPDGRLAQGEVLGFAKNGAIRIYNPYSQKEEHIDYGLD
ncbi:MAG: biotin--[acetyl-CoA-carboxylase] ligase [Chlamydia sp.]